MPAGGDDDRLRVGFDDQIFQAQNRGGISRAFVELIPRLRQHGIEPIVLSTGTRNRHLVESGLVPARPSHPVLERAQWLTWRATGHPRSMPRIPSLDVMHHTFTHGSYLSAWDGPRVVTVADMTPELFPEYFPLGNPHFAKRRYAEVSDAIIAVSQNTADDMYRLYSTDLAPKTHVVPNGVSARFFERRPGRLALPERYLLFVGVRGGYKHFDLAVEAFARLARTDPELRLVVVGGGVLRRAERDLLERHGVLDRVIHLSPPDEDMPEVYRRAAVFVFPSIYEGFGLPTIEALASGAPLVLADASVSRELGEDAALYADPGDAESLTEMIRQAMTPERAALVAERGPSIARRYDWDEIAGATAAVYRSASSGR